MSTLVQTTLEALVDALAQEDVVWVRLSADLSRDEWTLRLLEIISGGEPPRWESIDWRYPEYVFIAFTTSGGTAAEWLREGNITFKDVAIPAPFHAQLSRERRESGWGTNSCESLTWPSEEWRLSRTDSPNSPQARELISARAPSFANPDIPTARLLGVSYAGYNNSAREFVVRQQDRRGRLAGIRVDAAELTISVEGEDLAGATVELASTTPGPTEELDASPSATIRFPLPNGLPELAWLVLRNGNQGLDSRSLSWPTRGERPGVEYVVSSGNRLEAVVVGGESSTLEFKEQLPEQTDRSRRNVLKTVAAFANGAGGTILFGVTNDGAIVGLQPEEDQPDAEDSLTILVKSWVHPLPHFELQSLPVPDNPERRVIAVVVNAGDQPPYAAGTTPDNMTFYVRRSATTFAVMPDEVRTLALRNQAQPTFFPR